MKTCPICQIEFVSKYRNLKQVCCSKSCGSKLKNQKQGFGQKEKKPCEYCGKDFSYIASRRTTPRFCSQSCVSRYRQRLPHIQIMLRSVEHKEKVRQGQLNINPLRKQQLAEANSIRMK